MAYLCYGADPKQRTQGLNEHAANAALNPDGEIPCLDQQWAIPDDVWVKIKEMYLILLTAANERPLYRSENQDKYPSFRWCDLLKFNMRENGKVFPSKYILEGRVPYVHRDDLIYFFSKRYDVNQRLAFLYPPTQEQYKTKGVTTCPIPSRATVGDINMVFFDGKTVRIIIQNQSKELTQGTPGTLAKEKQTNKLVYTYNTQGRTRFIF